MSIADDAELYPGRNYADLEMEELRGDDFDIVINLVRVYEDTASGLANPPWEWLGEPVGDLIARDQLLMEKAQMMLVDAGTSENYNEEMEVGGFGEGDFDGDAAADGGADESVALEHGSITDNEAAEVGSGRLDHIGETGSAVSVPGASNEAPRRGRGRRGKCKRGGKQQKLKKKLESQGILWDNNYKNRK